MKPRGSKCGCSAVSSRIGSYGRTGGESGFSYSGRSVHAGFSISPDLRPEVWSDVDSVFVTGKIMVVSWFWEAKVKRLYRILMPETPTALIVEESWGCYSVQLPHIRPLASHKYRINNGARVNTGLKRLTDIFLKPFGRAFFGAADVPLSNPWDINRVPRYHNRGSLGKH